MLYHIYLCVFFDTLQSVMDVSHMNMLWLKNDWVNFVILNVCFTCFCHKQPFPSVLQDLGLSASLYHHLTAHLLNDQEIFYNYSIYIQIHFPLVFIFFLNFCDQCLNPINKSRYHLKQGKNIHVPGPEG